jgi:hypothetical protein
LEHWKLLLLPIGFDLHSRRERGGRSGEKAEGGV